LALDNKAGYDGEMSTSFDVQLPPRILDSHKGDFGRILLIGGSQGMAGAMGLAGMAALRSGAGLVRLAVPAVIQSTVASYEPSYTTIALPHDTNGRIAATALEKLRDAIHDATVVAIGPGLGRSSELTELVAQLYREISQPLVIDADGLNALAELGEKFPLPNGPRVLTPHPGEFARLLKIEKVAAEQREMLARDFARTQRVVVVLKGRSSIITDGKSLFHNTTGNPGMATGGTGDVLTGVIAALVGQGLSPLDAARLGTHVHGLAGDLAAEKLGQVGLIASDLIDFLPLAFQAIRK
jgi:NAD(P)H-hydrate epimerase